MSCYPNIECHTATLARLQKDILLMQGFKPAAKNDWKGPWPIRNAFPHARFPLGAVHEFITSSAETLAATTGFMAALLGSLAKKKGVLAWIGETRPVFPPALAQYGLEPGHVFFIDIKGEADMLWAMEEALKCAAFSAVIGETGALSFLSSRRLQLVTEQSQVTAFLVYKPLLSIHTTACIARWKITSLPGSPVMNMPGVGYPRWQVELLKARNGRPSSWQMEWSGDQLQQVFTEEQSRPAYKKII